MVLQAYFLSCYSETACDRMHDIGPLTRGVMASVVRVFPEGIRIAMDNLMETMPFLRRHFPGDDYDWFRAFSVDHMVGDDYIERRVEDSDIEACAIYLLYERTGNQVLWRHNYYRLPQALYHYLLGQFEPPYPMD